MANETITTIVGNLTADPELRFTPNGVAVANFTVASTPRTFHRQSGEWRDGDALFMRCTQEICDMFSTRTHAITPKAAQLIDAFRERFSREPSALERSRLEKRATLATRPAKSHNGETEGQRLDRWEAQTRAAMLGSLSEVAQHVLDLAQQP